jgi:hypothetical protein
MSNLKEFLKKRAEVERSGAGKRRELLRDWVAALETLRDHLSSWLREADEDNILTLEKTTRRIRERQFGTYEVPGLRILLGTQEILVEPVGRFTIASYAKDSSARAGRVDITNGENKYILNRLKPGQDSAQGDRWEIVDDETYQARPLDRSTFEAAIQSLLE